MSCDKIVLKLNALAEIAGVVIVLIATVDNTKAPTAMPWKKSQIITTGIGNITWINNNMVIAARLEKQIIVIFKPHSLAKAPAIGAPTA